MSKSHKILRRFRNSKNKQILKVTALYVIWNPEICPDPPTCGQHDVVLLSRLISSMYPKLSLKLFPKLVMNWLIKKLTPNWLYQDLKMASESKVQPLLYGYLKHSTPLTMEMKPWSVKVVWNAILNLEHRQQIQEIT